MASLYQRTLRSGTTSPVWWMKYSAAGRVIRQTTGTTDKRTAQRFLDSRVGRAAEGQPILPRADRVRYEEAAEDLRQHYATTGSRGTVEAGWRLAHLGAFFAGRRLVNLGPQDASAYVAHRQGQGASNATINRELAVLGRMLRLAVANNKLMRMPDFRDRKPKEAAPRAGFFEPEQYESVRRRLPADLQAACAIAYTYGWRMRSEVLTLRLNQLDLKAGTLRLEPGMTKNDDGRLRVPHPGARAAPGRPVGPRGGPGTAARARAHHPVPVPALHGDGDPPARHPRGGAGRAAHGVSEGLGDRVQGRRLPRNAPARLPPHGRAQPRSGGGAELRGHEDHGTPDRGGVSALHDHVGRRPAGRGGTAGHIPGHTPGGCA